MKKTSEQVQNKADDSSLSAPIVMNKTTTRPDCFSSQPARMIEDCQECHYINECHNRFQELCFYGPN
jgi:hypothetical protein